MFEAAKMSETGLLMGNMKASSGGNITKLCTNIKNCRSYPTLTMTVVCSLPAKSPGLEQLVPVHGRWHWLFHAVIQDLDSCAYFLGRNM